MFALKTFEIMNMLKTYRMMLRTYRRHIMKDERTYQELGAKYFPELADAITKGDVDGVKKYFDRCDEKVGDLIEDLEKMESEGIIVEERALTKLDEAINQIPDLIRMFDEHKRAGYNGIQTATLSTALDKLNRMREGFMIKKNEAIQAQYTVFQREQTGQKGIIQSQAFVVSADQALVDDLYSLRSDVRKVKQQEAELLSILTDVKKRLTAVKRTELQKEHRANRNIQEIDKLALRLNSLLDRFSPIYEKTLQEFTRVAKLTSEIFFKYQDDRKKLDQVIQDLRNQGFPAAILRILTERIQRSENEEHSRASRVVDATARLGKIEKLAA